MLDYLNLPIEVFNYLVLSLVMIYLILCVSVLLFMLYCKFRNYF